MAKFAHKEIEDKFYQDILSTEFSDKYKTKLIQDYMLVYGGETIPPNYALVLLKIMGCDIESLNDETIESYPVFSLDNAHKLSYKFIF